MLKGIYPFLYNAWSAAMRRAGRDPLEYGHLSYDAKVRYYQMTAKVIADRDLEEAERTVQLKPGGTVIEVHQVLDQDA